MRAFEFFLADYRCSTCPRRAVSCIDACDMVLTDRHIVTTDSEAVHAHIYSNKKNNLWVAMTNAMMDAWRLRPRNPPFDRGGHGSLNGPSARGATPKRHRSVRCPDVINCHRLREAAARCTRLQGQY